MASYHIERPGSQKRDNVNNFGRAEVIRAIFPKFDERLIDVQIDEVMSWTIVVDVLKVTPMTRVWARIEYGAGSNNSTDFVDVADHVDYPVVGDSVRVAFGVESTFIPSEGGSPTLFTPIAAQVVCLLSAEFPGYTFPATYFPPFLVAAASGIIGPVSGFTNPPFTPQAVPARLAAYQANLIGGGAGAAFFFLLFDQNTPPTAGDTPVWSAPFVGGQAQLQFLNPRPFDNSVQWAVSTAPQVLAFAPGVGAAVFGELTRRPTGQIVTNIQEISGGLF